MNRAGTQQRVKKSYSLSCQAVAFISKVRKARRIGSDSETLDTLIREAIEVQRKSRVDAAYRAYYDAATDVELAEEKAWAEFSGSELTEIA